MRVTHEQQFLDRVARAGKANGLVAAWDFVMYYDADVHHGDLTPFHKSSIFEYQSEFRIAVQPGSADPIRLNVGSLEDITTPILPLSDINQLVSVTSIGRP